MYDKMFFRFDQNNSGGYFEGYHYVYVEADSYKQANERAQKSGLVYFEDRGDCVICCGYRWSARTENDTIPNNYDIFSTVREVYNNAHHQMKSIFTKMGDAVIIKDNGSQVVI